jgi:hypothetical protein
MILRFSPQPDSPHNQIFRKAGKKKAKPNRLRFLWCFSPDNTAPLKLPPLPSLMLNAASFSKPCEKRIWMIAEKLIQLNGKAC